MADGAESAEDFADVLLDTIGDTENGSLIATAETVRLIEARDATIRAEAKREERFWAAAWVLDRAEQYANDSPVRAAFDEIMQGLAEGEHLAAAKHGELDDALHAPFIRLARAALEGGGRVEDVGRQRDATGRETLAELERAAARADLYRWARESERAAMCLERMAADMRAVAQGSPEPRWQTQLAAYYRAKREKGGG